MKKLCFIVLFLACIFSASAAVKFEESFRDSTLRADFIFSGMHDCSDISLRAMSHTPGWAGRRVNLSDIPWHGNGQVSVVDSLSGDTIYRQAFSSLFQEWQSTPEAKVSPMAYEASYIVPLPKRSAYVTVELFNTRRERVGHSSALYRPDDILVADRGAVKPHPYTYIHRAANPDQAIDIAIVAEGFTKGEMKKFRKEAQRTVDAIFSHEPFKSNKDKFNFIAVELPSQESGVSVPRENKWRRSALSSHYDTFYSVRYLTTSAIFALFDGLTNIPFEHIIILANSPTYGGGGIYNTYTITSTTNPKFVPVTVHEFGHSFGGLGDEYFYDDDLMSGSYPLDIEPWEPNITTLVDFDSKWKALVPDSVPTPTPAAEWEKYPIGVFEGAGYSSRGLYRPADRCRMRDNDWPGFCPACIEAIEKVIRHHLED